MNLVSKLGCVAMIAGGAALLVAGCSSTPSGIQGSKQAEGATGTVGLAFSPISGATLNSIHFIVTKVGSSTPIVEGDQPTPGTGKTFTVALSLPVGTGYVLSLSGVAVERATLTCAGSFGPFDILPNQSTNLSTTLTCVDTANGSAGVAFNVTTDACPRLVADWLVASPSRANAPGGVVALAASAHDLDGKAISYAWLVSDSIAASVTLANAPTAQLTCNRNAQFDVTVVANNGECTKKLKTQISCTQESCGNGLHDPGEVCDPSAGDALCLPNCQKPQCGNGIVEPGEQCDPVPADLGSCTTSCQTQIPHCGDGLLSPGEACDGTLFPPGTPAGVVCTSICTRVFTDTHCGDGLVEPGEVCEPAFSANNCGSTCGPITTPACLACENDPSACEDFVSCDIAIGLAQSGPAAGTRRSNLCNEVLDCVRKSACAAGGNAPINCYCGTASGADCQAGLGNGACKAQIERGLETTAFTSISARFKNTTYGGGVAMARVDCDQNACASACGL